MIELRTIDTVKQKNQRILSFLKDNCFFQEGYKEGQFKPTFNTVTKIKEVYDTRSFEDIYSVIKYYYPKCTVKHFAKQLQKFIDSNPFDHKYSFLYCNDADKWILSMSELPGYWENIEGYINTFNYDKSSNQVDCRGCGEYTLNELSELLNLKL